MGYLGRAAWGCVVVLLAACGSSTGGTTNAGQSAGHPFACGSLQCDSATQYCSIVTGGVALPEGGSNTWYSCASFDGGKGCPGGSSATSPGQCGCYQSSSGEVTNTECVP
ncbi:MAG TPA: hypothetical protein VF765_36490 [Polyangiaceae bacterium]